MGIDIKFQAIPEDCALLEGARQKLDWAESITTLKSYANATTRERSIQLAESQSEIDFTVEAWKTIQANPGLEQHNLFWGRHWDMVHYLLSWQRRGYEPRENDELIKRAIVGGDPLPTNVAEDGYVPARYLSAVEVYRAAEIFNAVERADMYQEYDVEEMENKGVYKVVQIWPDDRGFVEIYDKFLELRDFYNLVASHNEGIVSRMY